MSIAGLKAWVRRQDPSRYEDIARALGEDSRAGARALASWCLRRRRHLASLEKRFASRWRYERAARRAGFRVVAGLDEAGRGPLAGPVVAAAVILPRGFRAPELDDSKRLSPAQRERLYEQVTTEAIAVGVGAAGPRAVDGLNVLQATYLAMRRAVKRLDPRPDLVLVDGFEAPRLGLPQRAIRGGDAASNSIAAASVVAKVTRDRIIDILDRRYPGYGFAGHKGYGTRAHIDAILRLGPCPAHRATFSPVAAAPGARHDPARRRGAWAEDEAVRVLRRSGYRIVERNYRCERGEIDIVAEQDGVIAFVEVRCRSTASTCPPEESVGEAKRARIALAAAHYVAARACPDAACRFDVVAIRGSEETPRARLLRDAFRV